MSEWAYRECPICGWRTHMNFYCGNDGCNGDPWGIEPKLRKDLAEAEKQQKKMLERHKKEVKATENTIQTYKDALKNR